MAMSAVYTTFDGELISEIRGCVESLYVPDTLGSVVEVRNSSGAKVYSAEYWPYGEVQTESGTNPSPWGYVGILGYLKDLANLLYVRARHYRPNLARWQNVDPLWPSEGAFAYVECEPIGRSDRTGLAADDWENKCLFRLVARMDCASCGADITLRWWRTDQHKSNHFYTHCFTCCILAKKFGDVCAMGLQIVQNHTPGFGGTDGQQTGRLKYCSVGIKLSHIGKADCHSSCIAKYPAPPGHKSAPLPVPPECGP
jgi:RHS repeat-associated protein